MRRPKLPRLKLRRRKRPRRKQHQPKPGSEQALDPAPMYDAPFWRGSGKLEGKVALISGGDSGIGRAVAVLFAREGADVAIAYLAEDTDAEERAADCRHQLAAAGLASIARRWSARDPRGWPSAGKVRHASGGNSTRTGSPRLNRSREPPRAWTSVPPTSA